MNILLYCDDFLTRSMTFVYYPLMEARKQHEISVACLQRLNADLFPISDILVLPERSGIIKFGDRVLRKLQISFNNPHPGFEESLTSYVQERRIDLVHAHFGVGGLRVHPVLKKLGIPLLVTFHGYDASQLLRNCAYLRALRAMMEDPLTHGITVSERMRLVLGEHGVNVARVTPLHPGVDAAFFGTASTCAKKNADEFVFLQVSNFVEKKGHEYTLRAFAELVAGWRGQSGRRPVITFAGGGPLKGKMEELASRLGLADHVRFVGPVDRVQARELMAAADVFVHHSVTASNGDQEGLPTVLMETMAMGLPVISTRHAGIPELVRNGEDGILIGERDVPAYSAALQAVYEGRFGPYDSERSRQRIVDEFNLSTQTERLLTLYAEIAGAGMDFARS